ncbi:HAMP domain-containing protein [Candidatus Pacearchaeota archaeon]|nr:HAMP domain-containing protein [Candidatus Pacearchaeota archaeon]
MKIKIQTKIISGFIIIILIATIFFYISINSNKKSLEESIGLQSLFLAQESLQKAEREIYSKIEIFQEYSHDTALQEAVLASNKEFKNLTNISEYINQKDSEWISAQESRITEFMQKILENELSLELKEKTNFWEEEYKYPIYAEVFVTNKYGANIAQTGKTSDYYQADEIWWQKAKEQELYIGELEYDTSAKAFSLPIAIKIHDENNNFIGTIKVVLDIRNTINLLKEIEITRKIDYPLHLKLLTNDKKLIYATGKYTILKNMSKSELYDRVKGNQGSFIIIEKYESETKKELIAYVISKKSPDLKSLGWTLFLEHELIQIFEPINIMKRNLIILVIILSLTGAIITILISYSISKPVSKLKKASFEIAKGNLNHEINIKSSDEIGDLAKSFTEMTKNLKLYQQKLIQSEKQKGKGLEIEVVKKTKQLNEQLQDLNNTKTAILNIMEDMSHANEDLKALDKAKSNFLNMISHELKTPLTALIAHLEVIDDMKSELPKAELKSLEAIRRNANNLQMLIVNILEIARMESGKFELTKGEVNIQNSINNLISRLEILAKQKNLPIIPKVGKLPLINADENRINEILNNLTTNAIKFTEKGTITISAIKKGNFIEISVKDTGVGIPKDKIKNLFRKFYQVDASLSRRYGGTGLGLSITRQLIESHGGKIWVKSDKGKGATFTFTLPIK